MRKHFLIFVCLLPFIVFAQKKSDYITIQKTPCFGKCPVFTFTLKGNGEAILKVDTNFTMAPGYYNAKIEPERTKMVFQAFKTENVFRFENEYVGMMTDFPITYLTYKRGRKVKKIKDHYKAPPELKNLEGLLINLINETDTWKKINN